jgi:hypothetical protein
LGLPRNTVVAICYGQSHSLRGAFFRVDRRENLWEVCLHTESDGLTSFVLCCPTEYVPTVFGMYCIRLDDLCDFPSIRKATRDLFFFRCSLP